MNIPEELKYTREHEWLHIEEGIVTFGITDWAQSELGDIVFVELPGVGDELNANDSAGMIEAVKTVADLFAPVSGEVVEVNERLVDDPDLMNRDPYGEGWMVRLKLADESELEELLTSSEYEGVVDQSSTD